jgi:hypothetical protein
MAKPSYTSARLDDAAVEDAKRLLAEMRREGTETSRDKIVRALLWGVTSPQAVGMLRAYIAHAEASLGDDEPSGR